MYKDYYSRNNADALSRSSSYPQSEQPASRFTPSHRTIYNSPPRIPLSKQPRTYKLHKEYPPSYLDIDQYQYKTEYVDTQTLQHLDIASKTIQAVDRLIPYGAGNQWLNVVATKGESDVRCDMLQDKIDEIMKNYQMHDESLQSMIETGLTVYLTPQYQAGNCSEMSIMAHHLLITKGLPAPILTFADGIRNHAYTLIGDPRDHKWGTQNTVVVDAWFPFKTAYTLKQASYNLDSNPRVTLQYPASTPSPDSVDRFFREECPNLGTVSIDQYLVDSNLPPVGDELIEHCYDDFNSGYLRDERIGTKDPSTLYTDGSQARTFDDISEQELNKHIVIQKNVDRFLAALPD